MSLCTTTELADTLGTGTLYTETVYQEICDAADNVLLPFIWSNKSFNIGHSSTATTGTLYFEEYVQKTFYVGQTIVVTGNGSHLNGSKTVTEVGEYSVTFTINNGTVKPYHPVNPFGTVAAETYLDPSTVPAIQEAALMIAVDIFQSRKAPAGGGVSIDGFTPSPYRMGNTLLARIRGLISPYLDPRSLVG